MRTLWGILRMLQVCWCPHTSELILCLTVSIFRLLQSGRVVFSKNPVWYHDEGDYTTSRFVNDYSDSPIFQRKYVALDVSLRLQRAGRGILVLLRCLFWIVYLWPNVIYICCTLCAYVLLGSICFTHSDSFAIERCNILGRY